MNEMVWLLIRLLDQIVVRNNLLTLSQWNDVRVVQPQVRVKGSYVRLVFTRMRRMEIPNSCGEHYDVADTEVGSNYEVFCVHIVNRES